MLNRKTILLVDDEPSVLRVLKTIIQFAVDSDIATAANGREALDLMEKKTFDVIIVDMKMPGIDGADLIDIVHELYPRTARMVFSARAGGESGLRTVGSAHQYFMKPNDIKLITERISGVLKLRELLPDEGLEQIISKVRTLPSLPGLYAELDAEIRKPTASIEAVGRIIEKDMSMSAKTLQLVNSAFFGHRGRVSRASEAAALLGMEAIKALTWAIHFFSDWKDDIPDFSITDLSRHSLNVAAGAKAIAEAEGVGPKEADEYYSAGLFHDIGKLVIAANLPDSFTCISKMTRENGLSQMAAEKQVVGATHAETGAYLLALWGFADPVMQAAAYHHALSKSGQHGFNTSTAVHVANVIENEAHPEQVSLDHSIDTAYLAAEKLEPRLASWRDVCNAALARSAAPAK